MILRKISLFIVILHSQFSRTTENYLSYLFFYTFIIEMISYWIQHITDIVCGYPLFILLIGGGLFLFIYSRALPLRKLRMAFDSLHMKHRGEGSMSSFQALMTTISSTVGMGNIAGVAIALCVGGPGAIFWMWVSAFLGMATKFFEGTLAIMYKGKDANGVVQGGPMHVLTNGISPRMKPLAILFSAATLVGCLVLMQANQLTESICQVCLAPLGVDTGFATHLILGIVIGAIVSIVIFGGIQRIATVATRIVPFMVGFYFVMVFGVMIAYADRMPGVFGAIIDGAFCWEAGFGAFAAVAMTGARRAMFVNEAGVGTAGMMHGASMNAEPVREGLVAMLGPVIDSGFVCTLSAIPMIMAGMYQVEGVQGLSIALNSFDSLIPYAGKYLLEFVVTIFAFSTMFSYSWYGTMCTNYLFGPQHAQKYRYFYVATIVASSVVSLGVAVSIIDFAFVLMAIPNMIGVFILAPKVKKEAQAYFKTHK